MPTYKSDSSAWRSLLKPLVLALVGLCAAGTAYIKAHSENTASHDAAVERIVKLETRFENAEYRLQKVEMDADLLKGTLADMKSDLSFIRGKMEATGPHPTK